MSYPQKVIFFALLNNNFLLYSQGNWMQKANFGGTARYGSMGFSIGNKGYIAMGYDGSNRNDFWEWNQPTNTWAQKANCPGAPRRVGVGFSIGNKGYVATGYDGGNFFNDLWEWNITTNNWVQKANIPTNGRYGAACFVIGTKAYISCGNEGNLNGPYFNDLWEWDQSTDSWTQKTNYPGGAKYGVSGFAIGNKGYCGFGYDNTITTFYNDLWEWNQTTNTWSPKAGLPCTERHYAVSFSVDTLAYVGLGLGTGNNVLNDFWEYGPATNKWKQKANFGGGDRWLATGFTIGNKAYVGTGLATGNKNDFWEYDSLTMSITYSNNLCGNTINFSNNVTGADSYLWNFGDGTTSMLAGPTKSFSPDGNYNIMLIVFWSCSSDTVFQTVTVNSAITSSPTISICNGDSVFLQGNYQYNAGIYYDTLSTVSGCDSIVKTTLTINSYTYDSAFVSLCFGDSIFLQGNYQSSAGVYNDTVPGIYCDSVRAVTLTIFPPTDSIINATDCNSYTLNSQTYTSSGIYTQTLSTIYGCDSTITVNLTILQSTDTLLNETACNAFPLNGQTYSTSGTYSQTHINGAGCDSTIILNLIINFSADTNISANICADEIYTLGSQNLTSSGNYSETFTGMSGCDSTVNLALIVNQGFSIQTDTVICSNDSILLQGFFQNTSGIYYDTLQSVNGCDSLMQTNLTVISAPIANSATVSPDTVTILFGDSVHFAATAPATATFLWSPPEFLNCTACFNPIATPDSSIVYYLKITDKNGCFFIDSSVVTVEYFPCAIFTPNCFTPNEDKLNDFFRIYGMCADQIELLIFDRWGKIVWKCEGAKDNCKWNGTFMNTGEEVNSAVFVYHLQATLFDKTVINKIGRVTLLR